MIIEYVTCPHCHSTDIIKHGKSAQEKQRYFCQNKHCRHQIFIWNYSYHGYDAGKILAYVFGLRKNKVFKRLKKLLRPFGIKHFYTDDWGAYERHLDSDKHHIGKRNTQKIERKHHRCSGFFTF